LAGKLQPQFSVGFLMPVSPLHYW